MTESKSTRKPNADGVRTLPSSVSLPESLIRIAERISARGCRLFAVGGLVRNTLLGLPVSDIDICSALTPDETIELVHEMGFKVVPKGIAFGMVEIHADGQKFEHTTFRADKYSDGGAHRPTSIQFSKTPEEDSRRRDFSVNALYCDILTREILDPSGGLPDLENRVLRTSSIDPEIVLADDGLRILRLVRFAAELQFKIDPATFACASRLCGNLRDISAERIRDELNKLLLCDIKYGSRNTEQVLNGLLLLRDIGALAVILPELSRGRGIAQKPTHHRYDVLDHALHTAAESKPMLVPRLAGLLHDVAKPVVLEKNGNMHGHDAEGEIISREIMQRLRYDNKTTDEVCFIVRHHMYDLNNTAKDKTLRRTFARWGVERSLEIADIRDADVHGSGIITGQVESAARWRILLQKMQQEGVPFSAGALNCSGADIMNWLSLPASPAVGKIKAALLAHCAVYPADNTPARLKKLACDMLHRDAQDETRL